jgi:peroxiredoxin Q/BCP
MSPRKVKNFCSPSSALDYNAKPRDFKGLVRPRQPLAFAHGRGENSGSFSPVLLAQGDDSMRLLHAIVPAGLLALALPLLAADEAAKVEVGKPAPNINLPATQIDKVLPGKKDAKKLTLKDFQGRKNVVLFFYPKAMTPGCTRESCKFRDLNKEFAKLDTVVLGISTDDLKAQKQFTDKESLNFPLFADADKKITQAYGVLNEKRGMANRSTFIIDKKGIVRKIYASANADKNPDEVLDWIKENLKGGK